MSELTMEHYMQFVHGLSCATRIHVLKALQTGEKNVSELLEIVGGTQSNLSQHLACLKGCGFVTSHPHGKYMYYQLSNDEIGVFLDEFDRVVKAMHWSKKDLEHCKTDVD